MVNILPIQNTQNIPANDQKCTISRNREKSHINCSKISKMEPLIYELNKTISSFLENPDSSSPVYTYYVEKRKITVPIPFNINKTKIQIARDPETHKYMVQITSQKPVPFEFQEIKDSGNSMLLLLMNMVRLYYVDQLLHIILAYFTKERNPENIRNYFNVVKLGSTELVSNYNITVSGVMYPQQIVEYYNYFFYQFWNNYSALVFDTNIYGSSFFITVPNQGNYERNRPLFEQLYDHLNLNNGGTIYYLHPKQENQEATFLSQIKWLLLKIAYHTLDLEIRDAAHVAILDKIKAKIQDLIHVNKNINKNHNQNQNFARLLAEKHVNSPHVFYRTEDIEKKIQKYEESQIAIQEKQVAYEERRDAASQLELIDYISRSNYYGFETYFCMGTIYHVVGHLQGGGKFEMTPYYYMESAIENFIDVYRYYGLVAENPEYALIKMSKYIYRMYDALLAWLTGGQQRVAIQSNRNQLKEKRDLFATISKEMKMAKSFANHPENKDKLMELYFAPNKPFQLVALLNTICDDICIIL